MNVTEFGWRSPPPADWQEARGGTVAALNTSRLILDFLGFAALLILILFGITLAGVGGFFFVRIIGENLREEVVSFIREQGQSRNPGSGSGLVGDRLRYTARIIRLLGHTTSQHWWGRIIGTRSRSSMEP